MSKRRRGLSFGRGAGSVCSWTRQRSACPRERARLREAPLRARFLRRSRWRLNPGGFSYGEADPAMATAKGLCVGWAVIHAHGSGRGEEAGAYGRPMDSRNHPTQFLLPALLCLAMTLTMTARGQDSEPSAAAEARPRGGAIRWDAWTGGAITEQVERTLGPARYHDRLPWFAEMTGENSVQIDGSGQEVMDREIGFAAGAGLDFWAFLLYAEDSPMSVALGQYLRSRRREEIRFCLILHNTLRALAEDWPRERDRGVALLREPGYETVLDQHVKEGLARLTEQLEQGSAVGLAPPRIFPGEVMELVGIRLIGGPVPCGSRGPSRRRRPGPGRRGPRPVGDAGRRGHRPPPDPRRGR